MALYLQNISKSSKNYPGVNSPGNFFSKLMITSMCQFVSTQKKEVINGEWGTDKIDETAWKPLATTTQKCKKKSMNC